MQTTVALAEWRSSITGSGGQCVMISGTSEMPTWFVDNWSVGLHIQHCKVQLLDRAGDQSGWTMSIVMVMKHL